MPTEDELTIAREQGKAFYNTLNKAT